MMLFASSKLFLVDIILKGNSVTFQGLEGTSLHAGRCVEASKQCSTDVVAMYKQCSSNVVAMFKQCSSNVVAM